MIYPKLLLALLPMSASLAGDSGGAVCSSRASSLVDTKVIDFSTLPGWKISAVNRMGGVSCRGEGAAKNGDTMTLIYDPVGKYRNGAWYLDLTSRRLRLKGAEEAPARFYLDKKAAGSGKVLAIEDSVGGKTTASYIRAEFPAFDEQVAAIKAARVVEVRAKGLPPLPLAHIKPAIEALERCLRDSTGPGAEALWKSAESTCN